MQNPWIQFALVVVGGFLASCGGIAASLYSDKLTRERERQSAVASRKREYLAFLESWKYEIGRTYLVMGGFERRDPSFTDLISTFIQHSASIKIDLHKSNWSEFDAVCAAISGPEHPTICGKGEYEKVIKSLEKVQAFTECHI